MTVEWAEQIEDQAWAILEHSTCFLHSCRYQVEESVWNHAALALPSDIVPEPRVRADRKGSGCDWEMMAIGRTSSQKHMVIHFAEEANHWLVGYRLKCAALQANREASLHLITGVAGEEV